MFVELTEILMSIFSPFNVFRYITFRSALSSLTAFLLTLIITPFLIRKLKTKGAVDNNGRQYCPDIDKLHEHKNGTPMMGGVIIIGSVILSILLWADIRNPYVWLVIISIFWMGVVGFIDDLLKLKNKSNKALSIRTKLITQILLGLFIGTYLYLNPTNPQYGTYLQLPFFKDPFLNLGIFYIPFATVVVVATINAVNVTDGLDGLATGSLLICIAAYTIISYLTGHAEFARYLLILPIPGSGELTVCGSALIGACLAFLWFNAHPAQIFMGDTGALALGGVIGVIALITKHEMLLFLVGGVFVIEILSDVIQILSYKLRGKRVFKRAPLHHHFELLGWKESQITIRFWIIGIILAILSLSTLRLR